jgi:hypothetical protein
MLKNQLINLYASITMDLKKTSNYLRNLHAGTVTDVKKPTTIYEIYMWVLHI